MNNKVTIIGAGMVGSTVAYSLVLQSFVDEIAMIDLNQDLLRAQVMDLQHTVPFVDRAEVKMGTYADCVDSRMVVITCGAAQKPGESRLELVQKNATIIKEIMPKIFEHNPNAIVLMVTNPVDVLTRLAVSLFPDKRNHIFGTGTVLDSARLRHLLGQTLHISAQSIHAYMLGEHGDSEFPAWSTATIGNMRLQDCKMLHDEEKMRIFQEAKNAAYTIIEGKQSTYYAIGAGCAQVIYAVMRDEKVVLPVSHMIKNLYGISETCLSMPAIVGVDGIEDRLHVPLNEHEQDLLRKSAEVLQETFAAVHS